MRDFAELEDLSRSCLGFLERTSKPSSLSPLSLSSPLLAWALALSDDETVVVLADGPDVEGLGSWGLPSRGGLASGAGGEAAPPKRRSGKVLLPCTVEVTWAAC